MDPLGNPILFKNSKGQQTDKNGRLVNNKGYLIDDHGNIVDKNKRVMFDKDTQDQEGDIPKVFRNGILQSLSGSSLSRLMSEIERHQHSDIEKEVNQKVKNFEESKS